MTPRFYFLCFLVCFRFTLQAQPPGRVRLYHISSSHTAFPDTSRSSGYVYDSVWYDATTHYRDSTVLLVVPRELKVHQKVNLIFWFHGWHNTVDSAARRYELIRQFEAAHLNAVLVLAETAKDAPDSYGGKLEQPGEFNSLVQDVIRALRNKHLLAPGCQTGNVLLAGHSGAYRVIAFILQHGKVPVQEVVLFDALYGEKDKFMHWIAQDDLHRFINWYTDSGGGTKEVSIVMGEELPEQNRHGCMTEEASLTNAQLLQCPILFVHSTRPHNDIINQPDNFLRVLQASPFLNKSRQYP